MLGFIIPDIIIRDYYAYFFTEMCYAYDEWQFKGEDYDEPLTYEEEMEEYYNEQWSLYQELWNMVQQAGGEVPITTYTRFLLDELQGGPYWEDMKTQFGTFQGGESQPEPEPKPQPGPEPEPESSPSDNA